MQMLVDLPQNHLKRLNALSRSLKLSPAELVRQAVTEFLAQNKTGLKASFGLWKDKSIDADYQEKLRREWV